MRVHYRVLWFAIITSFFAEALKCWLVNTGAREMNFNVYELLSID